MYCCTLFIWYSDCALTKHWEKSTLEKKYHDVKMCTQFQNTVCMVNIKLFQQPDTVMYCLALFSFNQWFFSLFFFSYSLFLTSCVMASWWSTDGSTAFTCWCILYKLYNLLTFYKMEYQRKCYILFFLMLCWHRKLLLYYCAYILQWVNSNELDRCQC